jgi:two-component system, sensor histidine kinase RegB
VFLLVLMLLKRQFRLAPWQMSVLLLLEITLFNGLIAINGAASNPFNALLLVPLVLAFMLLPVWHAAYLLVLSIAAQVGQLILLPSYLMPQTAHHHPNNDMASHSYAMIVSFIITSLLIAAVIRYFQYQLSKREKLIQQLRERQLRDEQLLAIGTAAAQLTHDVSTPAQSIRLLLEEALEQEPQAAWLQALNQQFNRIEQQLHHWRHVADDVRENRLHVYQVTQLWRSLQQLLAIARPEAAIDWHNNHPHSTASIQADRTLLPALTNIILNACEEAAHTATTKITISAQIDAHYWQLNISNSCQTQNLPISAQLGNSIMPSSKGHGLGAILTNATIEKFGGLVEWQQQQQHMLTLIKLSRYDQSATDHH